MGAPRHQEGWTEPRVARLRKLWIEGRSATQIAADLGGGVTRNACIAKVHRLGLSNRPGAGGAKPVPQHGPVRKPKAVKPAPEPRPLAPDATAAAPRVVPAPLPPEPEVAAPQLVTLIELAAHACKWPVGFPDPVQRFCGRRQAAGRPYCAEHSAVAFSAASSLAKHSTRELARSLRRFI